MKVKITSCSNQNWWYRDCIGDIFTVAEILTEIEREPAYQIIAGEMGGSCISATNCEVVPELPNKPAGMNDKQLSLFIIN